MIEWCGYLFATPPLRFVEYETPPVRVECVQPPPPVCNAPGGDCSGAGDVERRR